MNKHISSELSSHALDDWCTKWWGYLDLNQGPIGYAYYHSFRYPFGFEVWTIPFPFLRNLPSSLYTFPAKRTWLGIANSQYERKVSPNLTDKHYKVPSITALVKFSYQHMLSAMNCIICWSMLSGKQRLFCSISCKNQKHQSYPSQKVRGFKRKLELIRRLGWCCVRCGYKKNLWALSFHHTDPSHKEFKLDVRSLSNRNMDRIEQEVKTCILLCHNCHAEEYYPELDLEKVI